MTTEYRLPFGKFYGLTMADLRNLDREYFDWLGPWLDKVPSFEPECKREWEKEAAK